MIKLQRLVIEEFRGIRRLEVELNERSFVVHGPNGSGKSGVIDAIGFALTGTIGRLTGTGSAGLTVLKHGPHVHKRDDPAAAKVALTFIDVASGQVGTVTRTVKAANQPMLTPDTTELRAALAWAGRHPELALSRREIIKFILTEASKRADEVQALLQLDRIAEQRKALNSARNKLSQAANSATSQTNAARQAVLTHFGQPTFVPASLLAVVNEHRETLGLVAIAQLESGTDMSAGVEAQASETPFDKQSALRDVAALLEWLEDTSNREPLVIQLVDACQAYTGNPLLPDAAQHRSMVATGLTLLGDGTSCPLCDTAWETPEALRAHLEEKIAASQESAQLLAAVGRAAEQLQEPLRQAAALIERCHLLAQARGGAEIAGVLLGFRDNVVEIGRGLANPEGALLLSDRLDAGELSSVGAVTASCRALDEAVKAQPDNSAQVQARSALLVGADRWKAFQQYRSSEQQAQAVSKVGADLYQAYCTSADGILEALYAKVETRFSAFYRQINEGDEVSFKAELTPSSGKLDLAVDFYSLGMFPPGAYHSEGHQDGMGICLYLALLERILNEAFTLALLDDVVTSVDMNHRRQFCELLKNEFPDVQFIITTHDKIWAKQMVSAGLVSRRQGLEFHDWTVTAGPAAEHGKDYWDKIDEDLQANDVPGAASRLRRALEAELPEIAEALGARVAYRGDARYDMGEYKTGVDGRYNELLKKGADSASSWNDAAAAATVKTLQADRVAAIAGLEESWAVNLQVHHNAWAQMSKQDFAPVVASFKRYLQLFQCENDDCGSWVRVEGSPGHETTLRCDCGSFQLNLKKKNS